MNYDGMNIHEIMAHLRERFVKELWPINKMGNPEIALTVLADTIRRQRLIDGSPVTFDHIKAKYQEYINYIEMINSKRDPKYHSKVKTIQAFIGERMYDSDFKLPANKELDNYLYGI